MDRKEQIEYLLKDKYSKDVNVNDWNLVHPNLVFLCYNISLWAHDRNLPMKWTSLIRDMIQGISKTDIHKQKRAADFSIIGWTTDDIDDCLHEFSKEKYKQIAAISLSDKKPRAIDFHNGTNLHGHAQVRAQ